jgi:CheY-like chemotaxis protein
VDLVHNGEQALRRLREGGVHYHAVLMDVHMPVMDGLEATRRIRLDPAFEALPIIAMTASALPREREVCLQSGMNDQVNKPIDVEELFGTLRRWVGGWSEPDRQPEDDALPRPDQGLPQLLPGIDLQRAMRTVESASLLKRLLISFGKENAEVITHLERSLAEGDLPAARRIVHSVKGVGGNLGATGLFRAGSLLEEALRESTEGESLPSALALFRDKLAEVLASVTSLLREGVSETEDGAEQALPVCVDRDRLASLALNLSSHLQAHNLNALNVWQELKPLLPPCAGELLDAPLQSLDFGKASELLGVITQDLQLTAAGRGTDA